MPLSSIVATRKRISTSTGSADRLLFATCTKSTTGKSRLSTTPTNLVYMSGTVTKSSFPQSRSTTNSRPAREAISFAASAHASPALVPSRGNGLGSRRTRRKDWGPPECIHRRQPAAPCAKRTTFARCSSGWKAPHHTRKAYSATLTPWRRRSSLYLLLASTSGRVTENTAARCPQIMAPFARRSTPPASSSCSIFAGSCR
mmetsp:Transcript_74565/g.207208  ORF Transcript_74565/g.207208 Transcript_74565/m.207208 type:complete len:201 (-) Transcript_74565:388-990(-)